MLRTRNAVASTPSLPLWPARAAHQGDELAKAGAAAGNVVARRSAGLCLGLVGHGLPHVERATRRHEGEGEEKKKTKRAKKKRERALSGAARHCWYQTARVPAQLEDATRREEDERQQKEEGKKRRKKVEENGHWVTVTSTRGNRGQRAMRPLPSVSAGAQATPPFLHASRTVLCEEERKKV